MMKRTVLIALLPAALAICGCFKVDVSGYADLGKGKSEPALVSCDVRIIDVSDASLVASASDSARNNELKELAKDLAKDLKKGMSLKGQSIAVANFRNRSGTALGRTMSDDLSEKLSGALHKTGWFKVKERLDLSAILDEQDLDNSRIVNNPAVRRKLSGINYVVLGGVTVVKD